MAKRGTEPAWRKVFLTSLAATGNVTKSASVARITRPGAYKARKENAAFAQKLGTLQKRMPSNSLSLRLGAERLKELTNRCFMLGRNAALSVNTLTCL